MGQPRRRTHPPADPHQAEHSARSEHGRNSSALHAHIPALGDTVRPAHRQHGQLLDTAAPAAIAGHATPSQRARHDPAPTKNNLTATGNPSPAPPSSSTSTATSPSPKSGPKPAAPEPTTATSPSSSSTTSNS